MKMKSFAMLLVSGLCVASLAYVAPALADDMNNSDTSQTVQPSAPADNLPDTVSMGTSGTSQGNSLGTDTIGGTNGMDPNTPDAAAGDDDY